MNKRVLNISLILLLASTGSVFAQQGFGTNKPSQSAAVDIVSPNKGLLIPRVALQADNLAAPITNPETSLLVFNTTATNNLTKGFYYWTGTNWEPFTTESTDSDNQQIIDFSIGANNIVTLELERGGTKQIDLSPYFNSTKLANGTNTTVSGTGTATDQYKVNVATGNDRTLGVVREAETDPTVNITNGELAVNLANTVLSGEVTGPLNNTIVKDDVIDAANLKTNAVTTAKITDANVTPIKIQPAAAPHTQTQVMVTGTDGIVKWVDQSTISPATTVSNTSPDNTLITTVNGVLSTSVDLVKTVGLSLTGSNLTATVNGVSNTTALDLSSIDTDNQQISLASNILTLERGGTVNLAPYLDNTDNQQLSYAPATNVLSLTNGGSVDLSALAVDTNTDNQQISYNAATRMLSLERGGDPVDLSALATDNNTITTVKADAAQSYVSVTSNPVTPGATIDREYTVGVSAATAQVGATAGTAGVVKPGHQFEIETDGHLSVKYAMPEFFYFPAINIPLSNPNGSLDLYGIYASRWGAPMAKSATTENTNLADIIVPVNMVDIFITYYDDTVIENVVISDAGEMTYTVKPGYVLTDESYMNILFKIRKTAK